MAEALRPSNQITDKQNVNPSINRITEATAEDFQEIGEILIDHAVKLDLLNRTDEEAEYYGVHSSLAVLQAAFPNAPNSSWAVIDPGNENPKKIATVVNGVWEVNQAIAPILLYNTKLARDQDGDGVEGIIYVVKDEKIFSLWYDGKFNDFGKDGANGLSAYQIAVAVQGFEGTEAEWLATLIGKSAYQSAVDTGFEGTEAEWIASIEGVEGKSAYEVAVANGFEGTEAEWIASIEGVEGKSAYEVAVANGFVGTEAEWLTSLEGPPGDSGDDGDSAYEVAVANGFQGTEAEWIASIEGVEGKSAYEVALENGFVGTEAEWLASLEGAPGEVTTQQMNDAITSAVAPKNPILVTASRNLAASDNGENLCSEDPGIEITYPVGGLGAAFRINCTTNSSGTFQLLNAHGTTDGGTFLPENSIGHVFVWPNGNLTTKGDWE